MAATKAIKRTEKKKVRKRGALSRVGFFKEAFISVYLRFG